MKIIMIILFFFLSIAPAFSQGYSYNEEFQFSTIDVGTSVSPSSAELGNGDLVVCWAQQNNYNSEVYAKIYDKDGISKGDEFQVNSYTDDYQLEPCVSAFSEGKFVVIWKSNQQDGSEYGIYGQIYNITGTKIGGEFKVNTYTISDQRDPTVTGTSNGGFVVVWESWGQDGGDVCIFAQIYNSEGNKVGSEFQVNSYIEGWQCNPKVVGLSTGGFLINWKSETDVRGIWKKYIQKYDKNGVRIGSEILVDTSPDFNSLEYTDISSLPNGEFVTCWITDNIVNVQVFDKNNNKKGNKKTLELPSNGYSPTVCELDSGRFAVFWILLDDRYQSLGIFAQIFNNNGKKIGSYFLVNKNKNNVNMPVCCESLSRGGFLVIWQGKRPGWGIFGKYYLSEPINHNLTEFELLKPEFDVTIESLNPQFAWNNATQVHINFPWELIYDLYIDTDELFLNPIINYGIQDTTYQIDSLTPGNTYFWKVLAKNISGDSLWSSNINGFYIDPNATDIEITENSLPDKFELFQNYPNPFNPTTIIKYTIPNVGNENFRSVQLKVYDVLGKEVATLVNKEQPAGSYEVEFDANTLTSGIYFYRIITGKYSETRKMILMK